MKKAFSLILASVLLVSSLAACTSGGDNQDLSVEDRTTLYQNAVEGARDEQANTDMGLMVTGDEVPDIIFELLGVSKDDMSAYALSVSAMNVQAYGIAVIYPAAGKSDAVLEGLNGFVEQQKQNFNMYLMDQYDIANAAKVATLEDGTVVLVMCENQDEVFASIQSAIEAGK